MLNFPEETAIRDNHVYQGHLTQLHRWLALQMTHPLDVAAKRFGTAETALNGAPCTADALQTNLRDYSVERIVINQRSFDTWVNEPNYKNKSPTALAVTVGDSGSVEHIDLSTGPHRSSRPNPIPHRILALKHRWHELVEAPVKQPEQFREIVTDEFSMDWGFGGLSGYDELSDWVTTSAASVDAARHDIVRFEWQTSGQDREQYQALFEFDWFGYSKKSEPMHAQSRHTWQILDAGERSPRLLSMHVEFLTPFHVVHGESR